MYLCIDQWGNKQIVEDVSYKSLREKFGAGPSSSIRKMYRDRIDNKAVHCGYVVGCGRRNAPLWIEIFKLTRIGDWRDGNGS